MAPRMQFAIVVSRFNQNITQRLLKGAQDAFQKQKIQPGSIKLFWVPGAFEIPTLALKLAKSKKFNAIVCLGCVLQGETLHNRYISESVTNGILYASLITGIPITFGILTPNNLKQAMARSGKNSANKGTEAAEAAIEMTHLIRTVPYL